MLTRDDIKDMLAVDMGMGSTCSIHAFLGEDKKPVQQRDKLDDLREYLGR